MATESRFVRPLRDAPPVDADPRDAEITPSALRKNVHATTGRQDGASGRPAACTSPGNRTSN